jgi:hypothetical protein
MIDEQKNIISALKLEKVLAIAIGLLLVQILFPTALMLLDVRNWSHRTMIFFIIAMIFGVCLGRWDCAVLSKLKLAGEEELEDFEHGSFAKRVSEIVFFFLCTTLVIHLTSTTLFANYQQWPSLTWVFIGGAILSTLLLLKYRENIH